jgi:L-2-hydroxyglutarate oxidase
MIFDYCVIGGGIVGLATAMRLLETYPGSSLILLEKEEALGKHQTDAFKDIQKPNLMSQFVP